MCRTNRLLGRMKGPPKMLMIETRSILPESTQWTRLQQTSFRRTLMKTQTDFPVFYEPFLLLLLLHFARFSSSEMSFVSSLRHQFGLVLLRAGVEEDSRSDGTWLRWQNAATAVVSTSLLHGERHQLPGAKLQSQQSRWEKQFTFLVTVPRMFFSNLSESCHCNLLKS